MMDSKCKCSGGVRLCPVKLGISFGVASAIFMIVVAWAGWLGGYGKSLVDVWSATYPGFAPTFVGGLAGAVWGFVYGFFFGAISGLVYSCCSRCGSRCKCCDNGSCGSNNNNKIKG